MPIEFWSYWLCGSDLFLAGAVFFLRDGELELNLMQLVLELPDLLRVCLRGLVHVGVVILQTLNVILSLQQL